MQIKLNLNDAPLIRGFKDFKTANRNAVKATLDIAVAQTRRNAINNIKSEFTLRNDFTVKSIAFDKAELGDINQMESRVGATQRAYYLETQEEGGTRRHGRGGASTGRAALGMKAAREGFSPAKAISKAYYVSKIKKQRVKGKFSSKMSPKARSVAKMYIGKKYNLYINRGNDIFKVRDFTKIGRNNVRVRLEHIYTIHQSAIHVKQHKWLEPATQKPARDLPFIYHSQLKKQWKTGPEKL